MNTEAENIAYCITLRAAAGWFAGRPDLCTSPQALLLACRERKNATIKRLTHSGILIDPWTMKTELQFAGECAAKDCAMPSPRRFIEHLINPEDLQ
jgi:hypothetical protein